MTRLLVTDDDPTNRRLLSAVLRAEGFEIELAEGGEAALASVAARRPDLVLLDLQMPGLDGLETLARLRRLAPEVPVVMLTSHGDVSAAVEAVKRGAQNFLVRPLPNEKLLLEIRRALELGRLEGEVSDLRRRLDADEVGRHLVAASPAMRAVVEQIGQVARTPLTVLIVGETGTGKELVARAIHRQSDRSAGPFVAVDCGAVPESLAESILFGHEKGAFSGAHRSQVGRLALAAGGTAFLDEIGNLPSTTQPKLLRALQEKTIQSIGGAKEVRLDARILAASNAPLDDPGSRERFRQDLYFRLAEFVIRLPPLRERQDDVLPLARAFLSEAAAELSRPACAIADDAARMLLAHPWPGNVRELRNVIRRAVLSEPGTALSATSLRPLLGQRAGTAPAPPPGGSLKAVAGAAAEAAERVAIAAALRAAGGNKSKAARALGVDVKTLQSKLRRYQLAGD